MAYMSSNHSASDMGSISFFVLPREKVFPPAQTGPSLPLVVDVKSNLDRNQIVIPYPAYLCDQIDTVIFLLFAAFGVVFCTSSLTLVRIKRKHCDRLSNKILTSNNLACGV